MSQQPDTFKPGDLVIHDGSDFDAGARPGVVVQSDLGYAVAVRWPDTGDQIWAHPPQHLHKVDEGPADREPTDVEAFRDGLVRVFDRVFVDKVMEVAARKARDRSRGYSGGAATTDVEWNSLMEHRKVMYRSQVKVADVQAAIRDLMPAVESIKDGDFVAVSHDGEVAPSFVADRRTEFTNHGHHIPSKPLCPTCGSDDMTLKRYDAATGLGRPPCSDPFHPVAPYIPGGPVKRGGMVSFDPLPLDTYGNLTVTFDGEDVKAQIDLGELTVRDHGEHSLKAIARFLNQHVDPLPLGPTGEPYAQGDSVVQTIGETSFMDKRP